MSDYYDAVPVRIPVRFKEEGLVDFSGEPIPLKDGSIGELVISCSSITDEKYLSSLKAQVTHKVLEEGTALLVALTIKLPSKLDPSLMNTYKVSTNSSLF